MTLSHLNGIDATDESEVSGKKYKKSAPISQAASRAEQADFCEPRKLNHRIRKFCALPALASAGQDTFLASLTFNSFFISAIFCIAPRFDWAVVDIRLTGINYFLNSC
ncbi:MAG: hypothetical protein RSE06_08965 [Comamonas sp.]